MLQEKAIETAATQNQKECSIKHVECLMQIKMTLQKVIKWHFPVAQVDGCLCTRVCIYKITALA